MAVSTTTAKTQYNGNGSTTVFSIPWYFLANSQVVVITTVVATGVETVKTLTTHYTLSGAANPVGGSLTMLSAPATGTKVTIYRNMPFTQPTDYVADDAFNPETVEADFDRVIMTVQQLQDQVNRCLQYPRSETTDVDDATLDLAAQRADTVLGFDSDGAVTLIPSDESSAVAAAASAVAAAVSAAAALASQIAAAASAASASAIASGVLTTKGDLAGYSTVVARLAVGANNTALFADSALALGVGYKTIDLSTARVTGTLTVDKGGTGLAAIGTALQQIRVNAGATAIEYFTDTGSATLPTGYTSSAQTITAAGTLTLAHGLGATPRLVFARLKCTSTDQGYSVNDQLCIHLAYDGSTADAGLSVVPDATNLNIKYGQQADTFSALNKSTGAHQPLTNTKWQLIIQAIA